MLASRLNELAAANDQGLLDDDEYRILRQNAFERYSSRVSTAAASKPAKPTASTMHFRKPGNNIIASFIRRATSPLRSTSPTASRSSSRKSSEAPNPHLLSPPTSPTRSTRTTSSSQSKSSSSLQSKSSSSATNLSSALSVHDIFEDGGLFTTADIRRAIADLDEDAMRVIRAFDELEESAVRRAKAKQRVPHSARLSPPSNSTTAIRPSPTLSRAKSTNFVATATSPSASVKPPSLRKKGSVSSLASSLFSLKTRPSMPSLSSVPIISRSRSDSAASTSSNSNGHAHPYPRSYPNQNGAPPQGSHNFAGRRSMSSMSAETSNHGRTSTSTGRPSTSSIRPNVGTRDASHYGHPPYTPTTPTPTTPYQAIPLSASPSRSGAGSLRWRADSLDTERPGQREDRTRDRARGRERYYGNDKDRDGDSGSLDEIQQIQQRKRAVIGKYEARKEYLKARLRGAELHERIVKGR